MKVLVTGGAGFIGSNLVRALLEAGRKVRVIDNLSSGYAKNLSSSEAELVIGDVRDPEALGHLMNGVEVVFHLAAAVGNKRSIDNPIVDSEVNVIGTLRVLEAARIAGVRKVVISSSAGIYGELKHLPIREDHPTEPDTPYGASKLAAEKQGLVYAKLFGLEVVSLRYFNVYGPNQRFDAYGNVIPIFAFKMLRGDPITVFGDGEQTRDFVNVHDVVQANLKAGASVGVSGAFNIASATQITINALVQQLEQASGLRPVVQHLPPRPGDVRHSIADVQAAASAFGYQPQVELSQGLSEYIEWARQEIS